MGDEFEFTGGCLCGAVRYECTEPPVSAGTCHCRECQQWTGSAYNAFVGFSTSALRFTKGKPKIFNAPSGIKELGFCSDCGSPLWDRYLVRFSEDEISGPHLVWMPLGTLDKQEAVTLKFHYGVETQLRRHKRNKSNTLEGKLSNPDTNGHNGISDIPTW